MSKQLPPADYPRQHNAVYQIPADGSEAPPPVFVPVNPIVATPPTREEQQV